jgi:hypothetical protein
MKAASSTGARRGPAKPPTRAYINITLFEYDILHHLNMFFFVPKAKTVSQCVAAKPLVNLRIYNYSHYPHHKQYHREKHNTQYFNQNDESRHFNQS